MPGVLLDVGAVFATEKRRQKPRSSRQHFAFCACAGNSSASFAGPHCGKPNLAARVQYNAFPAEPPIAVQQGITGAVHVLVGLDKTSKVVAVAIQSSPSVLLNAAAIDAAKRSTYSTAIVNCESVASTVLFVAAFGAPSLPLPGP